MPVAEKTVDVSMESVASAPGHNVDGASVGESKFGVKSIAVDLVLLDSINRKVSDPVLPGAVLILTPVNGGEVIAAVAAANGEPGRQVRRETRCLASRRLRVADSRHGVNVLRKC